jgi:hypothetical protein
MSVMLSLIYQSFMLGVVMLNVVMLSVVMLNDDRITRFHFLPSLIFTTNASDNSVRQSLVRFLASTTNITQSQKCSTVTNTLAYFARKMTLEAKGQFTRLI